MISNEEMTMFIKEIYLLIIQYNRCDSADIKNQINNEILILSEVIKQ
ncbi:hypothetical protein [Metabacillus bambusae]|uniref:Sporulation histidine kinase inhibitor Sda n=1 Tax=Metabacillus bambusae TaxID=2795218 RepID=A0ABS3NBE1_9BACI|nr:hypothetical protein [Metabacillus bambusae]MBO1515586.1 hypothetical protein [Metabacillus bambusae]